MMIRSEVPEASLQEKVVKEKQKYSDLLGKYEELQSSLSLGSEVQIELAKLQLTMKNVNTNLEKVEATRKYFSVKVAKTYTYLHIHIATYQYTAYRTIQNFGGRKILVKQLTPKIGGYYFGECL